MNYTLIYCVACLVFCTICIYDRIRSKQCILNKVDPLLICRKNLLIFFTIFFALTFILPIGVLWCLKKCFLHYEIGDANFVLLATLISQSITLAFILYVKKHLKLNEKFSKFRQKFKIGLFNFGYILPIILIVSCLWLSLLIFLRNHGWNISLEEQSMILLFSQLDKIFFKVIFFILAVVIAPFIEEYVFRGCIYRVLKGAIDSKWAAIWTNFMFAAMHMNLVSLLPLFILSLFLIKSYEESGDIMVPIVIHGAFNCNSFILMLLTACK